MTQGLHFVTSLGECKEILLQLFVVRDIGLKRVGNIVEEALDALEESSNENIRN